MQPVYRWGQHTKEHFKEGDMPPALLKLREWLIQRPPSGERVGPDSWWEKEAVPAEMMDAVVTEMKSYDIHEYGFRAATLKRAPKVAFKLNTADPFNHVIIIRYSGPGHYAPDHHDKQDGVGGQGAKDILANTPIVSITACDTGNERTFTVKADDGSWNWAKKLGNRDVFVLGPETNKLATHGVPKEGREGQVRYSIIFRHVRRINVNALAEKAAKNAAKPGQKRKHAGDSVKTNKRVQLFDSSNSDPD
jgi:hypothetical protein